MIIVSKKRISLLVSMAILDNRFPSTFQDPTIEDLQNKDQGLLNHQMLRNFANKIKNCFPTCVATVLADENGFPVFSEIEENLDENLLALSAIEERRKFLDLTNYHKIVKPLGNDIRMLILLKKARENYVNYGTFERTLKREGPFS